MLWDDFINSYWRDWRTGDRTKDRDKLEDTVWLQNWLEGHALSTGSLPGASEMDSLKNLRSLLFSAVQDIVAGQFSPADYIDPLNNYMAKGPVMRQLVTGSNGQIKVLLAPSHAGWEQVMAEIAASFADALTQKEPGRFRICDNPDCLWVYYDDTRNRSKRFCDDKACGNLMKVRRFRARKKAEAGEERKNMEDK